ncbi:MAG: deoxyhypusine synthase [Candidatus Aenigmarchaeota archaeon]|nr:deoxyhypusine synthase [Candidatus Aenigmarchaeota archaeon]
MEVKDFEPKKQSVDELIKQMRKTAFNARKLGEAVEIIEEMIRDKNCVKFLGLAGALVPAGMSKCIVEMIKNKWVDIIVSTGANITHELANCFGEKYYQCEPEKIDDLELREKGLERIYDVYASSTTMAIVEKNIQEILSKIKEGEYATFELLEEIGKSIDKKDSILKAAFDNKVKIIVPGLVDSILGIQVWLYSQDHNLRINEMKDLDFLINLNFDLKKEGKSTGAVILGGGLPKNFILQSVLIADKPHKYVVQITTEVPEYGGLSGATLEEALSWGKVDKNSKICTVYCDLTIAFPIIVSSLKERF